MKYKNKFDKLYRIFQKRNRSKKIKISPMIRYIMQRNRLIMFSKNLIKMKPSKENKKL